MAIPDQHVSLGIGEVIAPPAWLRAFPAIAATTTHRVAQIALAAVADAQRPVHECLQLDGLCRVANGPDLSKRQLAGEDGAANADLLQEPNALGRRVVHLGAGDKGDGGQVTFE